MIQIRPASKIDLLEIMDIERSNMRETVERLNASGWSDENCLAHIELCLQRNDLWLCEDKGEIVGYYYCSPMRDATRVSLDSIQVKQRRQRQGVGTLLLNHFLRQSADKGFKIAALNVHVGSAAARLYARFGFKETKKTASHLRLERVLGCHTQDNDDR